MGSLAHVSFAWGRRALARLGACVADTAETDRELVSVSGPGLLQPTLGSRATASSTGGRHMPSAACVIASNAGGCMHPAPPVSAIARLCRAACTRCGIGRKLSDPRIMLVAGSKSEVIAMRSVSGRPLGRGWLATAVPFSPSRWHGMCFSVLHGCPHA